MDSPESRRAADEAKHLPLEQLIFDEETKYCWLTTIIDKRRNFFIYKVAFDGRRYNWSGRMFVEENGVNDVMQTTWRNFYNKHPPGPGTGLNIGGSAAERRAKVDFKAIIGETVYDGVGCYVRKMLVTFKEHIYKGEVYIPKHEFAPSIQAARKAYAEQLQQVLEGQYAVKSIEDEPQAVEPRYSVQFDAAPVKGRKVQAEIWDTKGQEMFRGKVSVVRLQKKGEAKAVLIRCEIGRNDEERYFEGDLNGDLKHGRFLCVDMDEE